MQEDTSAPKPISRWSTDAGRNSQLKYRYGITLEQFNALLAKQQGRCATCLTRDPVNGWQVDHCHLTGVVRAILCGPCNTALGLLDEDPQVIARLAAYVAGSR